jgi:hypothetical protein
LPIIQLVKIKTICMKIQLVKVVRAILPIDKPDGLSKVILKAGASHVQLEVGIDQENVWFKEIEQGHNSPKT